MAGKQSSPKEEADRTFKRLLLGSDSAQVRATVTSFGDLELSVLETPGGWLLEGTDCITLDRGR